MIAEDQYIRLCREGIEEIARFRRNFIQAGGPITTGSPIDDALDAVQHQFLLCMEPGCPDRRTYTLRTIKNLEQVCRRVIAELRGESDE